MCGPALSALTKTHTRYLTRRNDGYDIHNTCVVQKTLVHSAHGRYTVESHALKLAWGVRKAARAEHLAKEELEVRHSVSTGVAR